MFMVGSALRLFFLRLQDSGSVRHVIRYAEGWIMREDKGFLNFPLTVRVALVVALAVLCGVLLLVAKTCLSTPRPSHRVSESKTVEQKPAKTIGRSDTDHPLTFFLGKDCKVQFKRNALGAGADLPVSPQTDSINGAKTSCVGTLRTVTQNCLLLESAG
jgi:hypothetical protein